MGLESAANLRSYRFHKNTDEASQHLTANSEASAGKAESVTSKDRLSASKKNVLRFAKTLLKGAGDFALDRIVGAGVAVGAFSLEDAPMIKQMMRDSAIKVFRYQYVNAPKRIANKAVPEKYNSKLANIARETVYRGTQAMGVVYPIFVPYVDCMISAQDKLHAYLVESRGKQSI